MFLNIHIHNNFGIYNTATSQGTAAGVNMFMFDKSSNTWSTKSYDFLGNGENDGYFRFWTNWSILFWASRSCHVFLKICISQILSQLNFKKSTHHKLLRNPFLMSGKMPSKVSLFNKHTAALLGAEPVPEYASKRKRFFHN